MNTCCSNRIQTKLKLIVPPKESVNKRKYANIFERENKCRRKNEYKLNKMNFACRPNQWQSFLKHKGMEQIRINYCFKCHSSFHFYLTIRCITYNGGQKRSMHSFEIIFFFLLLLWMLLLYRSFTVAAHHFHLIWPFFSSIKPHNFSIRLFEDKRYALKLYADAFHL